MKTIEVINHFGSKIGVARALNISPSAVTQWGELVPEQRQFQIEVLTNGKLKTDKKSEAA